MKTINKLFSVLLIGAISALSFTACTKADEPDKSRSVVAPLNFTPQNDLDKWLHKNYVEPYNIEVIYKYSDIETALTSNISPISYEKAIELAHLTLFMCIEPYNDVTGSKDFIRGLFPKVLYFLGSSSFNPNGTETLGLAEAGRKISLLKSNILSLQNWDQLNFYIFHTIHHEFGHIQNQIKAYPKSFETISGQDYVSEAWSDDDTYGTPADIKNTVMAELNAKVDPAKAELDKLNAKVTELETAVASDPSKQAELDQAIAKRDAYKRETYDPLAAWRASVNKTLRELSVSEVNALRKGFISPYGSSQDTEDFVEMQAFYITDPQEVFEARMVIAGKSGRKILEQKLDMVRTYLKNEWKVDLDALRQNVAERKVRIGDIDIHSVAI